MKKYLLICVTYHSNEELRIFTESVLRASERVKGKMQVDIEVADNGNNNRGYLGGALPIYDAKAQGYDFVSISNVDLELAPDFFEQLLCLDISGIGWLAPDIFTNSIQRHENPHMLVRPTKRNFLIWNIIYSYEWIYALYFRLFLLKNGKRKTYSSCDIYAGHGAFMLFTKDFVEHYSQLQFPGFMYGEEIWFAELVRAAGLKTKYDTTLHIDNKGSISTGLICQKQKSAWSKASLRAIYNQFFR